MRKVFKTLLSIVLILLLIVSSLPTQGVQAASATPTASTMPLLTYRAHVQNIGWMANVAAGELSGTTGRGLRMEALSINLTNQDPNIVGSDFIEYRAHVRGIGWQNFVGNGQVAGTTGRGLAIGAVQIRLVGAMAERFDVQYQVHMANLGWLPWVSNGAVAGTGGATSSVQAIRVRLVSRAGTTPGAPGGTQATGPNINYSTHVQNIGWQATVQNGAMAGTSGRGLRLEGFRATISDTELSGGIEYSTHVQNVGWQGFRANGEIAGTTGRGLRLEAIRIRLTGQLAGAFDVYYRVHVQNLGWLDWARNGGYAGTAARGLRLEGIEVRLVERGSANNRPQNTRLPFITLATNMGRRGLSNLESQLRTMTGRFAGQYSIYVRNLDTGEYMMINNGIRQNPASLMKVFAVGAAHQQIARGRMQMTPQIRRWMTETITISTNDSFNWLMFHIGEGCVIRGLNRTTDFARRHGYAGTVAGHTFLTQPFSHRVAVPGGSRTTARDVGLFLEDVYRGNIVGRTASNQIMTSLLGQRRLNKIPAGLPRGVRTASKTGEIPPRYEHDAAIVFSRGATYVIVVKSSHDPNAIRNIRTISGHVYRHFN